MATTSGPSMASYIPAHEGCAAQAFHMHVTNTQAWYRSVSPYGGTMGQMWLVQIETG